DSYRTARLLRSGGPIQRVQPMYVGSHGTGGLFGHCHHVDSAALGIDHRGAGDSQLRDNLAATGVLVRDGGHPCAWVYEADLPKRRAVGAGVSVCIEREYRIVLSRDIDHVVSPFLRDR